MDKNFKKIDELLEKGIITNEEYNLLRNKIIDNFDFTYRRKFKSNSLNKHKTLRHKTKSKFFKKSIILLVFCLLIGLVIFGVDMFIQNRKDLEEQREFALVQDRYLSYMDSSNLWNCSGGVGEGFSCYYGDNRAFTFGSFASIINFQRKYGENWAMVHVIPNNEFACYYGTGTPYYECAISDIDGVVTVTFSENFSGRALAIDRIQDLYLIAKEVDTKSSQ